MARLSKQLDASKSCSAEDASRNALAGEALRQMGEELAALAKRASQLEGQARAKGREAEGLQGQLAAARLAEGAMEARLGQWEDAAK